MKINHVAFSVSNSDRSVNWYQNNLGFKLERKYEKHGLTIAHLVSGEARIELFSGSGSESLPENRKKLLDDLQMVGTKHVCFEVDNVERFAGNLKEKGVGFETDVDTAGFGGKYVFIKDLDGILIELYSK
ncbi:MAG: VOC family protein [Candidatus Paceibacterota bacterium]